MGRRRWAYHPMTDSTPTGATARFPAIAVTTAFPTMSGGWPLLKPRTSPSRCVGSSLPPVNLVDAAMGVSMKPGQRAVTPTPCAAQSARRHWERWRTAALVVPYADSKAVGVKPNPDEILTTWPRCAASMGGVKAEQQLMTPSRLTERMKLQSSDVISEYGPVIPTPALFTRMVRAPCVSTTAAASTSISARSATLRRWASWPPTPPRLLELERSAHSDAVFSAEASSMSVHSTVAPLAAKAWAVARPIPLPAPVTSAVAVSKTMGRRFMVSVPGWTALPSHCQRRHPRRHQDRHRQQHRCQICQICQICGISLRQRSP